MAEVSYKLNVFDWSSNRKVLVRDATSIEKLKEIGLDCIGNGFGVNYDIIGSKGNKIVEAGMLEVWEEAMKKVGM